MKWTEHETGAHNHPLLSKVLRKFGAIGYGLYWYIVELIGEEITARREDNGFLRKDADAEYLALQLEMDEARITEILDYMVDIDLFQRVDGRLFCRAILSRCDEYTKKRGQKYPDTAANSPDSGAECPDTHAECPDSIGTGTGQTGGVSGFPSSSEFDSSPTRKGESEGEGGSGPDPPQVQLAQHWARRYFESTTRPFIPQSKEFTVAVDVLRKLGGDLSLGLKAVDAYFDEEWWFTRDKRTRKPSYSFGGFASHVTELLAPARASPKVDPNDPTFGVGRQVF